MHKLQDTFKNKRVFLTGHTGFKGAWMLQILHKLGAIVKGYSLAPENENDLYHQINGDELCYASVTGDLLDEHLLKGELIRFQPDFVFHLAAQSLVRRSYEQPAATFSVNVMGTINVLEALRGLSNPCVGLMVTTDKVYDNTEAGIAFREDDKLGGYDPYSASKAATEIAISSYRNSFFHPDLYAQHQKSIASVRAGNVIGGGDYSTDRIIPDIVRSVQREKVVQLRNPQATRPWQHVLEPLHAYLSIAQAMVHQPVEFATAFNVGPEKNDILNVETVTQKFIQYYGQGTYQVDTQAIKLHEAQTLLLDNSKIKECLHWQPQFNADQAIALTAQWYARQEESAREKCTQQIIQYGF